MHWFKSHPFYETIIYFIQGTIIGLCGSLSISYGQDNLTLYFGLLLMFLGIAIIVYSISKNTKDA